MEVISDEDKDVIGNISLKLAEGAPGLARIWKF